MLYIITNSPSTMATRSFTSAEVLDFLDDEDELGLGSINDEYCSDDDISDM